MEKMSRLLPLLLAATFMLACVHAGRDEACTAGSPVKQEGACWTTDADVGTEDSLRVEKFLRGFILSYENTHDASLLDSCMTPHACEIYKRMVAAHDCDMFVLAQDIPDDFKQTLRFFCMGRGWYRMEYNDTWSGKITINYFFVLKDSGASRIAYVHGFGGEDASDDVVMDSLFWRVKPNVSVVGITAKEFLHSFYQVYAAEYLSLDADVAKGTAALRKRYLSLDARRQYEAQEEEYAEDGQDGYDVLIGGFYTTMRRELRRDIREVADGLFVVDGQVEVSVVSDKDGWAITNVRKLANGE